MNVSEEATDVSVAWIESSKVLVEPTSNDGKTSWSVVKLGEVDVGGGSEDRRGRVEAVAEKVEPESRKESNEHSQRKKWTRRTNVRSRKLTDERSPPLEQVVRELRKGWRRHLQAGSD